MNPPRVALVQTLLAHYRSALFRRLDASGEVAVTFLTCGHDLDGIRHLPHGAVARQEAAPIRKWGYFYWQRGVVGAALGSRFDAIVLQGDVHSITTWAAALAARLRGRPVLFWTHGWRRRETGLKRLFRLALYRLADVLLIYSERGKRLGVEAGYPEDRMVVVYNSLDSEAADAVVAAIERGEAPAQHPAGFFAEPDRPLIVCTARLTPACRFDLLLHAAALLRQQGQPVNVLLVGDGPERAALERLAGELEVNAHFPGAVYAEEVIGTWIYHADIAVSPGKVGLTAIHSLMYGTPVISHDNLDEQMPEVEVIEPGRTGALFARDDARDLARTIADWLARPLARAETRRECRALIAQSWNPAVQCGRMVEGIRLALNRSGRGGGKTG